MHPLFLTHPITGRRVLYRNEGYAVRINELSPSDSDAMLDFCSDISWRCDSATGMTGTKMIC
ncbi:MAG: hypothetical protein ABSC06_27810 [Rhodopila sp.]